MNVTRTAAAVGFLILAALCGCSDTSTPGSSSDTSVLGADSGTSEVTLSEQDTGPLSYYDLSSSEDGVAPLPGQFGSPCASNNDCDSGLCIPDDLGKKFCTKSCVSDCPNAFDCVQQPGNDAAFFCVPHCKLEKCNGADDDCDGLIDEGPDNKTHMCEDGNLCTVESCNTEGGCQHTPQSGKECYDGSVCTINDICVNATCTSGQFQKCTDGDPCTSDSCNPSSGCVFTPISSGPGTCEDGNVCTEKDFCTKGVCTSGTKKVCNDGNDCTIDACDNKYAKYGGCYFQPVPDGEFGTCSQVNVPAGYINECVKGACKFVPNK